jgi:tetraacyldisaccharide 4'-kinase
MGGGHLPGACPQDRALASGHNAGVSQRDFLDLISGQTRGPWATLKRGALRVASWHFAAAAVARLGLYRAGVLRRHGAGVPVVCVGNLTTGGTGKTPAVAWVVAQLAAAGRKPAIVSRGYRAGDSGNDEQRVLEELCPGVPHVQNPDRVAGARQAASGGADVVVLDDGFSHLRLQRDLDILLFDALNPFGYGRMLPRGLLREPIRSVRRAKFAVFTRADVATPERLRDLEDTIRCKGFVGGVAHAAHVPRELVELATGRALEPAWLAGQTVAPFCGIGNPTGFVRTLEKLGARVSPLGVLRLDDHAAVAGREFERQIVPFLAASREQGATVAVCTQKDAVKLRAGLPQTPLPLHELRVRFAVIRGEAELLAALAAAVS